MSSSNIFTKSNLVYIPLSITTAHTLNFIFNSPLSTWKEFPPNLPILVYHSTFFIPLLLFISLAFEPIRTRKRFYTLLSLALVFISIPISFRGKNYPPDLQINIVLGGVILGIRMMVFLKFNRAYLNREKSDQEKEFKPYLWMIFNVRFDSYVVSPKPGNSSEKIITSPTTSQINQRLINRSTVILTKWLIYELAVFIVAKCPTEVPEEPYQVRLMGFFTKGIPAVTMPLMIKYSSVFAIIYVSFSFFYDIPILIATIFYRFFLHSPSKETNLKPILIRLGLLTSSEFVFLKEWVITLLFNTKHLFNGPLIASSPRDFWSVRWQSLGNEWFKEYGYLPVRDSFAPFVPRRIANMMGVLGAFGASALLHEYLVIGQFDVWTGEHLFFFTIHGVILILWEAVFGRESENKDSKVKRFYKWVLMVMINLSVLPAFIQPLIRRPERFQSPSYFAQYYSN